MAIRITSKREGFWRCGKQHSKTPKVWPDDAFNAEELKRLMADKETLDVLIVDDAELDEGLTGIGTGHEDAPPAVSREAQLTALTVTRLKELAAEMGLKIDKTAKKDDIVMAIVAAELKVTVGDDAQNDGDPGQEDPPGDSDANTKTE